MLRARTLLVILSLMLLPAVSAAQSPVLTVTEPELGSWVFEGLDTPVVELQVLSGEALDFSWIGDASGYSGTVAGYRYGWDVMDPTDPNDPGWATGFQAGLLAAPTQSFSAGVHTLFVEVMDDADGLTRAGFLLTVQVVPSAAQSWGAVKGDFKG
jgi:hypothetical protein